MAIKCNLINGFFYYCKLQIAKQKIKDGVLCFWVGGNLERE